MLKTSVALFALAIAAIPQTTSQAASSISGQVTDAGTKLPVPGVQVIAHKNAKLINSAIFLDSSSKGVEVITDAAGQYKLANLSAGQYLVLGLDKGRIVTKKVTLNDGQDYSSVDFYIVPAASLTGKVIDENNEPVPGISVSLMEKEYQFGTLRTFTRNSVTTDDKGEYELHSVEPGRKYLLLAQNRNVAMNPISDVPVNPKLRRPTTLPTYYPNSEYMESAVPIVARPGERRSGMDIRVKKSQSQCIVGILEAEGVPAALHFFIEEDVSTSSGGNVPAGGKSSADGRIRICNLGQGQYRLSALRFPNQGSGITSMFGSTVVRVGREDSDKIRVAANPGIAVPGRVVWDDTPPDQPIDAKLSVQLSPLNRISVMGETVATKTSVPGEFSLTSLLPDAYAVGAYISSPGIYVKEITYGGYSVLRDPAQIGRSLGDGVVRVTVACDGGSITALVTDKDGKAVPDANIAIVPSSASSESELAVALISGQTDQNGLYSSGSLRPGKYYILSPSKEINMTPESIDWLWNSRSSKAKEITVEKRQDLQVVLEATDIP
jgi:uncharacterized GH25 family protein